MAFASIKTKGGGGQDFAPAPPGVHFGICTQVIHLGKQKESYQGREKELDKVFIRFELPDVRVKYEKKGETIEAPQVIGQTFTLNVGDKSNLGPLIAGWRGKPLTELEKQDGGYDITSIIGKVGQVNVVDNTKPGGKPRSKIAGVFALIKEQVEGLQKNPARGKPEGELIVYSPDSPDPAIEAKLPNWIKDKLAARVQEAPANGGFDQTPATAPEEFDDDIPF